MSGVSDLQKGRELLDSGSIVEAIAVLQTAASAGIAEACVELARAEIQRGDEDAARVWIRRAEELAEQGDAAANLSCHLAYQMRYGEGDYDQQDERARYFLRRAAELGNPVAQTMYAQQLLLGLNGETVDEAGYDKWIREAIDQEFDQAIVTHVKNCLRRKVALDPSVKLKLEKLADRFEEARKLLQTVRKE